MDPKDEAFRRVVRRNFGLNPSVGVSLRRRVFFFVAEGPIMVSFSEAPKFCCVGKVPRVAPILVCLCSILSPSEAPRVLPGRSSVLSAS